MKYNDIHLTINTYPTSSLTSSQWTLRGCHREPERVAVRFNNKEYVIVLDEKPFFEVWSMKENEELSKRHEKVMELGDLEETFNA